MPFRAKLPLLPERDSIEKWEGNEAQNRQSNGNDQDKGNGVRLHGDCVDGCEHTGAESHHGF